MDLTLVIPAFNEEARLPATLGAVLAWADPRMASAEVVVVDDGSRDGTWGAIEAAAARDPRVVPVRQPANRGKGAAVREGVARSRGDVVAFLDADLAYGLDALARVLDAVGAGVDVAVGARDLDPRGGYRYGLARRFATRGFSLLVAAVMPVGVRDTQCGLKAFRGDLARRIFPEVGTDGFGFDVELLWRARQHGATVARVPVRMLEGGPGGSRVHPVRDGLSMAWELFLVRLRARRRPST
jgi:glycosyltransferase involved in cell wall biosynthesis